MSNETTNHRAPDGNTVPFSEDQMAQVHEWVAAARHEGAADAARYQLFQAAYEYFWHVCDCDGPVNDLIATITNARDAARKDMAEEKGA